MSVDGWGPDEEEFGVVLMVVRKGWALVGAEDAVVITVGLDAWFKDGWKGGKEVAPEVEEQEIGRDVTWRERVVDEQNEMVL